MVAAQKRSRPSKVLYKQLRPKKGKVLNLAVKVRKVYLYMYIHLDIYIYIRQFPESTLNQKKTITNSKSPWQRETIRFLSGRKACFSITKPLAFREGRPFSPGSRHAKPLEVIPFKGWIVNLHLWQVTGRVCSKGARGKWTFWMGNSIQNMK